MNDKKLKIAIYYISTGEYKKLFPEFLESVHNFFPGHKKIVKVISDGLEEFSSYEKGDVKIELCPRINNYPWPIVALYKMWHILENFDQTCDYACYFNGNAIIYEHSFDALNLNKITISYHSFNAKSKPYNPWPYININPNSSAYLENTTYEYVQSGFFFGPSKMIYQLCDGVVKLLREDTRKFMFAQWHDESYLNKWCVLHPELVDKKYIMTIYKNDIDLHRFVYLRDKRSYSIIK